eukprot:scaffold17216_cov71-Phaeocystis_antarctica.AAC.6
MQCTPKTRGCRLVCNRVAALAHRPQPVGGGRAFGRRERERAVRVAVGLRHLAEAEAVLPQRVVLRGQRGRDAAVVELGLERALGEAAAVDGVHRRGGRDDRVEAHLARVRVGVGAR